MKCHAHREREAVGVCVACGKGLCGEACAHESDVGLHCGPDCVEALRKRQRAAASSPVAWPWSVLMLLLGAVLLYFGYRYSEFEMNVPNLLGMLFVWYGAVLLLQRAADRGRMP